MRPDFNTRQAQLVASARTRCSTERPTPERRSDTHPWATFATFAAFATFATFTGLPGLAMFLPRLANVRGFAPATGHAASRVWDAGPSRDGATEARVSHLTTSAGRFTDLLRIAAKPSPLQEPSP